MQGEDGTIESWDGVIVGKEYVGTHAAARLGLIEKAGIGVGCKDHVAGSEGGSIVGIGCNIVEELVDGNHCVFGGCGLLLRANGAEGD